MNVNNSHQLWKHDISLYETLYGCERCQIRSCCVSMFANVFADFGWVVLSRCPFGLFCCSLTRSVCVCLGHKICLLNLHVHGWVYSRSWRAVNWNHAPRSGYTEWFWSFMIIGNQWKLYVICIYIYIHLFIHVLPVYLYVYVLCLTQVSKAGKSTAEAQPGVIQQRTQRVCAGAGAL